MTQWTRGLIDRLVPVARACFSRYSELIYEMNHQGDEAFISAALNILADHGQPVIDVGPYRLIGRHWSGNTHRDLRWFRHCALLHLPDSKALLVHEARRPSFSGTRIWRRLVVRHQLYRFIWTFRLMLASRRRRDKKTRGRDIPPATPTAS